MGTVGNADLYGIPSMPGNAWSPVSVMNPNGDSVSPPATQVASGGADPSSGGGAAEGLVGIIVAVVLLRILIHAFGEDQ